MLQQIAEGLTHLLFPRLCAGCNKPLLPEEDILCLNCNVYYLPRTAYHHLPENETILRFAGRFPFEKATSLAYFTGEGLLQHLLHELKYNDRKEIGTFLGLQLAYDLKQTGWANSIDAIIPVPLHPDKEKLRGYNQSIIIAEGMSDVLAVPTLPNALERIRNTESQTQKSREERIANVQEAFAVKDAEKIKGKHLLLIDDVLTTGATLESCALALLNAPGVRISIATVGIAV
ncbi:MAG: ComF family protein [Sphingobacteriales bacterium]|nr:MAG: ComF family protein [Sphingobacteriales bacterium]